MYTAIMEAWKGWKRFILWQAAVYMKTIKFMAKYPIVPV